jgi:hypothetical protein
LSIERFHIGWKKKPLSRFRIVAFSDGKTDFTPHKVWGRIFPENAPVAPDHQPDRPTGTTLGENLKPFGNR